MRIGNPAAPNFMDRINALEKRIEALEMGVATGLSGTDQTIKGSHDRLDSLLGAGVSAPDGALVSSLNADLLDGKEASAFVGAALSEANSASGESFTDETSYGNISNTATNISVADGDIVLAWLSLGWYGDAARATAAYFRLAIDTNYSQPIIPGEPNANDRQAITLAYAAEASGSDTWTVQGQCKPVVAADTISVVQQQLVVARLRPGG